jgi:hypothetical protein
VTVLCMTLSAYKRVSHEEYNCSSKAVSKTQRNMTSSYTTQEMYGLIVGNLNYEPKMIIRHIQQTYKYNIRCIRTCRAKQKMFEMRFGTYEASYDNLPHMLSRIVERNLESYYDVFDFPNPRDSPNHF